MAISYIVESVITQAGITAAINAGRNGPQVNVSGFRIGSQSLVDGAQALVTDTDVSGFVYEGSLSQLTYTVIDIDTVMWTIMLDTTIGNFQIGNIGIMLEGGVMFAKAVYPTQSSKYMSNPPQTVGNIKFFKILMRLANIASLINLNIIESENANIPEVPTELDLPPSLSSPFDCYMVDNHTQIGTPTTALRLNGEWFHIPHRLNPAQGQGVIPVFPNMFDVSCHALGPVYYDIDNNMFGAADSGNITKTLIGIRTSVFEISTLGLILGTACGLEGTLVPGTLYYVGTGANIGKLVTAILGSPVAIATSTTEIFIFSTLAPGSGSGSKILWAGEFGGTNNNLIATVDNAPTQLLPGMLLSGIIPNRTNTGPTTLKLNDLSVINCIVSYNNAFEGGELTPWYRPVFEYDGTYWVLISQLPMSFIIRKVFDSGLLTFQIGNTTTLSAGSPATTAIRGTSPNFIFDFGIPRGPTGAAGANGAPGERGLQGIQGPPGANGVFSLYDGSVGNLQYASWYTWYRSYDAHVSTASVTLAANALSTSFGGTWISITKHGWNLGSNAYDAQPQPYDFGVAGETRDEIAYYHYSFIFQRIA